MKTRQISLILALIFTFNHVLFANQMEKSFWENRQLARLPINFVTPAKAGVQPSLYNWGLGPGLRRDDGQPTIIHIQDIHQNHEAQMSISKKIQQLIKEEKVDLIALEGAFDVIDVQPYRTLPAEDTREQIAEFLLRENKISGPIHAALNVEEKVPPIIGVDSKEHYRANVEAYKVSAKFKAQNSNEIQRLKVQNEKEKKKIFNAKLWQFDRTVQDYNDKKVSFAAYIETLTNAAPFFSHEIEMLNEALKIESELNFKFVEKERSQLIHHLSEKMTSEESGVLMEKAMAFRIGNVKAAGFYSYLKKITKNKRIYLAQFPNLSSYIQYVLLSDSLNVEKTMKSVREMERVAYKYLVKKKEEKELVERSRALYLAGKLINFALTPDEWKEYQLMTVGAGLRARPIARKPVSLGGHGGPPLRSYENFYKQAEMRDKTIAENLKKAMKKYNAKSAILVTGGFHSNGIKRYLKTDIIPFTPKITKIDTEAGTSYLNAFTQEKTPIEKLFEGEKLFLAFPPGKGLSIFPALAVGLEESRFPTKSLKIAQEIVNQYPNANLNRSVNSNDIQGGAEVNFTEANGNRWRLKIVVEHVKSGVVSRIKNINSSAILSPKFHAGAILSILPFLVKTNGSVKDIFFILGATIFWMIAALDSNTSDQEASNRLSQSHAQLILEPHQKRFNSFIDNFERHFYLREEVDLKNRPIFVFDPNQHRTQEELVEAWWAIAHKWWTEKMQQDMELRTTETHFIPTVRLQSNWYELKGLNNPKGQTILDLGIGLGEVALTLYKLGAKEVIGLDISPKVAKFAEENLKDYKYPSRVDVGDVTKLPYGGNKFDSVYMRRVAYMVLPWFRPALIKDVFRVLRPGGEAIFLEPNPEHAPEKADDIYGLSKEEWEDELRKANFQNIQIRPYQNMLEIKAQKPMHQDTKASSTDSPWDIVTEQRFFILSTIVTLLSLIIFKTISITGPPQWLGSLVLGLFTLYLTDTQFIQKNFPKLSFVKAHQHKIDASRNPKELIRNYKLAKWFIGVPTLLMLVKLASVAPNSFSLVSLVGWFIVITILPQLVGTLFHAVQHALADNRTLFVVRASASEGTSEQREFSVDRKISVDEIELTIEDQIDLLKESGLLSEEIIKKLLEREVMTVGNFMLMDRRNLTDILKSVSKDSSLINYVDRLRQTIARKWISIPDFKGSIHISALPLNPRTLAHIRGRQVGNAVADVEKSLIGSQKGDIGEDTSALHDIKNVFGEVGIQNWPTGKIEKKK